MRKPKLSYDMISSLTTEQLKQLIKSEGKIANRRLQNLRKSGYYEVNPVISQKWNVFLNENPLATNNQNFITNTTNKKRSELIKQYKNIRDFLSNPTTTKETKQILKKHSTRLGTNEEITKRTLQLYGNSGVKNIIPNSDIVQKLITEHIKAGYTDEEVIAILTKLEQSQGTQEDLIRQLAENVDFLK